MHIEAGNFPYSEIGPKIKHSEIESRVFRRVTSQLTQHPLSPIIREVSWFPRYQLASKPKKGQGKELIFEVDELDRSEKYDITVIISINLDSAYLIKAEVRVIGNLTYGTTDWVMEAKSWEHNIISLEVTPLCDELLFHSRDFSKGIKNGHSDKTPWHHQWDVTTKKKTETEKELHFIWKPYYWEKPKDGIYENRRWIYKKHQMSIIPEFRLKDFFDTCYSFCASGIKHDHNYYLGL